MCGVIWPTKVQEVTVQNILSNYGREGYNYFGLQKEDFYGVV